MDISWPPMKLLYDISEENYDRTFSAYRFWIKLGAARGSVSNDQLYNDILGNASTRPDLITIPSWIWGVTRYYNNATQPDRWATDTQQRPPTASLHHRC